MVRFTQKVTLSPEALFQDVSGETVILDLKSEQYFSLDEVGSRIWQLIKENADLQEAFDILLEEYNVDAGQLEIDLTTLVASLERAGLVTLQGQSD